MIVKIDKTFEKDTRKISDSKIFHQLAELIESLHLVGSVSEIKNIIVIYLSYYRSFPRILK